MARAKPKSISQLTPDEMRAHLKNALEALQRIRDARDGCAEEGEYPEKFGIGDDQCFDDWAADIADTVLDQVKP